MNCEQDLKLNRYINYQCFINQDIFIHLISMCCRLLYGTEVKCEHSSPITSLSTWLFVGLRCSSNRHWFLSSLFIQSRMTGLESKGRSNSSSLTSSSHTERCSISAKTAPTGSKRGVKVEINNSQCTAKKLLLQEFLCCSWSLL